MEQPRPPPGHRARQLLTPHRLRDFLLPWCTRQVLEKISMSDPFGAVHMGVDANDDFSFTFAPPKQQ